MKVDIAKTLILLYLIFATAVSIILTILADNAKGAIRNTMRGITALLLSPVLAACLLWVDAAIIEPNWIEVTGLTVKSDNFDPRLKDAKIVQISDLHIEKIGFREKSLIHLVNGLKPDVLLITGDFTNSKSGIEPCLKVLGALHSRYGIYAILGNTDNHYFRHEDRMVADLESVGITVLRHDNIKLDLGDNGSLWLAGVSHNYQSRRGIAEAFSGIPLREPKITMIHNPDLADDVAASGYRPQLILAGHTHGGQFGIPFIRKYSDYASRSKYMAGMFNIDGVPLYVNRGIGMKTRDFRFLCRPEITVLRLERS